MSKDIFPCKHCPEHDKEESLVCDNCTDLRDYKYFHAGWMNAYNEALEDLRKWLWNNDKSTYHYLNNYYIAPKKGWLKEQKDDKN